MLTQPMEARPDHKDWGHAHLLPLLRVTLGTGVELVEYRVAKQWHDYVVLLAKLCHPAIQVVIKLAGPEAPIACPFDRTAALLRLVAAQTPVPVAEVLAVDVSYRQWPWRYAILSHMPGREWAAVRDSMDAGALDGAYRQIGEAVAHLHTLRFGGFGEFDGAGQVMAGAPYLMALRARATAFITSARLRDLFDSVLDRYAHAFDGVAIDSLCHEDLHGYNILFEERQGQWRLAAILDFDKAWAGYRESDLARLAIWTGMTGEAFWRAYEGVHTPEQGWAQRRPIYQLFWCLEYAEPTARHLADTARVCRELGIPPVTSF